MSSNESLSIADLGGTPWAKFTSVGDRVVGVIRSVGREQQTDYDTRELLTWPNGEPKMETVVKLEQDDGDVCALHARGGRYEVASGEGTSLEAALVDAVVAAGETLIKPGARLEVVHSGIGKSGKFNAKLYRAKYTPPVEAVPVSDLFSDAET